VLPAQRPQLLGPSARQQRHHQVGVQPIGPRLEEYVIDLFRGEGLRPAPGLAGRNVSQLHNIPPHLVPRHRPLDRSVQAGPDLLHSSGAVGPGQSGKPLIDFQRRQVAQLPCPERWQHMLSTQVAILRDRRRRLPTQPVRQPVLDCKPHRVPADPRG